MYENVYDMGISLDSSWVLITRTTSWLSLDVPFVKFKFVNFLVYVSGFSIILLFVKQKSMLMSVLL